MSRRLIISFMFLLLSSVAFAQEMKLVTGRVLDKTTGKPIDLSQVEVKILGFNTVAMAQDAKKIMEASVNEFIIADTEVYPDANGYYEITVPETGALIFKADLKEPVLELVNYRLEINVRIEMGNRLQTSVVTYERSTVDVLDQNTDLEGNYLKSRSRISIPSNVSKTYSRLIVQPFLLDGTTKDTLKFLKPTVMEGKEYRLTQCRRMNYDESNDPLNEYLSIDTLSSAAVDIPWADTIYIKDPTKNYQVKGIVRFEDYNRVYSNKEYFLASTRWGRPLRFLEYSMMPYMLDPEKYKERARREKRNTDGKISLNFQVGKAKLEDNDVEGRAQLDSVRKALVDVIHGEGSQLTQFHITGTASPDGNYASNQQLAKKRLNYAMEQIISSLPKAVRDRVYMTTTAIVAPWTDVADLLEVEGHTDEAAKVRDIVSRNEKSPDRQFAQIRNLPYYKSLISPLLPKLRSVNYRFSYEIFRELTPKEIMERYQNDDDYRSGRKHFALYEYWNLFNMVKEPDELMALYQRAYDESLQDNGKAWILAACNLAAAKISKGICDTTLLSGFIDLKTPSTDFAVRRMNGTGYDIINPEAVVANQMIMYVMANDFRSAGRLTNILPDTEKNKLARAFALCLGGYYKGGKTQQQRAASKRVFEVVSESSPRNKVVLFLAMKTKTYDDLAESAVGNLPQDDALTDYFRSVIYGRRGARTKNYEDDIYAEEFLLSCFKKDPSFVDIAAGDGDIVEEIFKNAKDRYELGE